MDILIGNLCSLFAMATDAVSTSRKTARGVLLVQTLSQIFYGAASLVLKGYSGAVQNAVNLVRNLAAVRKVKSKVLEWVLVVLAVALGLLFNNLGPIGWLPVAANLEYTLVVFRFPEDQRALKIAFLINAVMYCIFNGAILNFVGVVANAVVVVMTAAFLIRDKKNRT